MRLDSALALKADLISEVVNPLAAPLLFRRTEARILALREGATLVGVGAQPVDAVPDVHRLLALGVAPHQRGYRLAIRLQRPALRNSQVVEHLTRRAKGEVDIRMVGRIDKRTPSAPTTSRAKRAPAGLWYRGNCRPLVIGSSIAHVDVTAGTLGAFVERGGATCILSNNHVLANEDRGARGDAILQRATLDGGRKVDDTVASLAHSVRLKRRAANVCDAALARVGDHPCDLGRLRQIVDGRDGRLAGLAAASVDPGEAVRKIGRTTGSTRGRITAFELDNVVVSYDIGNLRFDGLIEIQSETQWPFSDGGDSGSLIVNDRLEAVALLFAGSDSGGRHDSGLTYANPIRTVLSALKATLLW